jgi:hypothetical protein
MQVTTSKLAGTSAAKTSAGCLYGSLGSVKCSVPAKTKAEELPLVSEATPMQQVLLTLLKV